MNEIRGQGMQFHRERLNDFIELVHGDCLDVLPTLKSGEFDAVVTDPPYGINYESGMTGHDGGTALPGIMGDADTSLRDFVLAWWEGPAIVFGSWKRLRPANVKAVLTWNKGSHVGMGDLSMPWKPNTEEIYIIGSGFTGHRGSSVLDYPAPVSWNSVGFGRVHSHEKPIGLMRELIGKCPGRKILSPFAGSGTDGIAAAMEGRHCLLIEKSPEYCQVIRDRVARYEGMGKGSFLALPATPDLFAEAVA